jgi:hypothetical protein
VAARVACAAALVLCVVVVAVHWGATSLACAFDTSNCAYSHEKDGVYEGVLSARGRPLDRRRFSVAFESRSGKPPVAGFRTDRDGRYCIVWAQERVTPFASTAGAGSIALRDWRQTSEPPPRCQTADEGIPWNRSDDRMSRPQFIVPVVLAAAAAVPLLILLIGGPTRRGAVRAGVAMAAVTTVAVAAVWLV